jgi:hypothetical protein
MKFTPNFIFILKNYLQQTQQGFKNLQKIISPQVVKEQVSNVSYQSIFKCNFHIVIIKSSLFQTLNFLFKKKIYYKSQNIYKIYINFSSNILYVHTFIPFKINFKLLQATNNKEATKLIKSAQQKGHEAQQTKLTN